MSAALKLALGIVLVVGALIALTTKVLPARSHPQTSTRSPGRDVYIGLRNQILNLPHDRCGLAATAGPNEPCAVLMDWGVNAGTATVGAVADGTVSIYLSSGGGSLGGGQSHAEIREAGRKFLDLARDGLSKMQKTTEYPLPGKRQAYFYVRTSTDVFTARASQEELSSHRHPLSALGDAAQEIITRYREIQSPRR